MSDDHGTDVTPGNGSAAGLYVTMTIDGQLFGVPVLSVQDVLGPQKITRIPLSPPEVAGALNLRGRIVTAIDVRTRLGIEPRPVDQKGMSIVVEYGGEHYSLMVDTVGEVLSLPPDAFERNLSTLDPRWRDVSGGIFRLESQLLVVLEVDRVLNISSRSAVAA